MPSPSLSKEPSTREVMEQIHRVNHRDCSSGSVRGTPQTSRHAVIDENRVRPSDIDKQLLDETGFDASVVLRWSGARHSAR